MQEWFVFWCIAASKVLIKISDYNEVLVIVMHTEHGGGGSYLIMYTKCTDFIIVIDMKCFLSFFQDEEVMTAKNIH